MKNHVKILNDIVYTEPKVIDAYSHIVHFGGRPADGSRCQTGNVLCLNGSAHRSATLNNLAVTCPKCIERLKAQGLEVCKTKPKKVHTEQEKREARIWDGIRLNIRSF